MNFPRSQAMAGPQQRRLFALGSAAVVLLGPGVACADVIQPSPWDEPAAAFVPCILIAGLMTVAIRWCVRRRVAAP